MAVTITAETVSEAWVKAMDHLLGVGDCTNLMAVVTDPDPAREDVAVRDVLDAHLAARRDTYPWGVETVANTIFPWGLYNPHVEDPSTLLYDNAASAWRFHKRRRYRHRENYFRRLIAYQDGAGREVNQLDHIVKLLATKAGRLKRCNEFEASLTYPGEAVGAAIHRGFDKVRYGFPCLSHLSFTLHDGKVSLTALYRSQNFVERAYGNYLGLSRLLAFVANESGVPADELVVVAAAATPEIGNRGGRNARADIEGLVTRAHAARTVLA